MFFYRILGIDIKLTKTNNRNTRPSFFSRVPSSVQEFLSAHLGVKKILKKNIFL